MHPLLSASSLVDDLRGMGEYEVARKLDEYALARFRRVLGEDHPYTLNSANNPYAGCGAVGQAPDGLAT